MESRQLRYFVKIADLRSISKASKALYVAQPSLSQQVANLESEFGFPLLVRVPTGVRWPKDASTNLALLQKRSQPIAPPPTRPTGRGSAPADACHRR